MKRRWQGCSHGPGAALLTLVLLVLPGAGGVRADTPAAAGTPMTERSVAQWLLRLHEASRNRAYIGTLVVTSAGGQTSAARIWHVCDGTQQIERVETLSGTPRATFRRNDQVVTFLPEAKVARIERRESMALFPGLLRSGDHTLAEFYGARTQGSGRVAGHEADVVLLEPRDRLRYGYRIWSEKKTGLVLQLQTLDTDGRLLDQVAFSELQLDAPVRMDKLAQMMAQTEGYRLEQVPLTPTTAAAEGWALKAPVAGFKPVSCYRRGGSAAGDGMLQWVFTDGLASVSLFLEPFDRQRHGPEGVAALGGATQSLNRRVQDHWLTVVGEVPAVTLQAFAQALERRR